MDELRYKLTINHELLESWLSEKSNELINNNNNNYFDLYIDDVVIEEIDDSTEKNIDLYIFIFNQAVNYLSTHKITRTIDAPCLKLKIDIDITTYSNKLQKAPKSIGEINRLLSSGHPDLVMMRPVFSTFNPSYEYYCIPVIFIKDKFFKQQNVNVYYSEYRSMSEVEENDSYTRYLTFIALF